MRTLLGVALLCSASLSGLCSASLLSERGQVRSAESLALPEYRVRLETSKGPIVVEVHRDWAPHGADRFYELVSGIRAGRQQPLFDGGNAYLNREFPRLDRLLHAMVMR